MQAISEMKEALRYSPEHIELVAERLRGAAHALGRLTGTIDAEDVLDSIFREFCIGK
jgi:tRNA modification GTPase